MNHPYDADNAPLELGHHEQHAAGWDGEQFTQTICPDIARDIDLANGWHEPGDFPNGHARDFTEAASLLNGIFRWLGRSQTPSAFGIKAATLVLVTRPDLLRPRLRSQIDLAEFFEVTRANISKTATQIFQLANGRFVHGNNINGAQLREIHRQAATRQHSKKGWNIKP